MIRMVLFAVGFLAITVVLVLYQPGARRPALPATAADEPITRAEPAFASQQADPEGQPAPLPSRVPVPAPTSGGIASSDEEALRRLTWGTLSNLNRSMGRESAPGQPGSLLHTIVQRSLEEAPQHAAQPSSENRYTVQPGDTLVTIAQKVYGDVNMTGPLYAANQSVLTRPDALLPGQELLLPGR